MSSSVVPLGHVPIMPPGEWFCTFTGAVGARQILDALAVRAGHRCIVRPRLAEGCAGWPGAAPSDRRREFSSEAGEHTGLSEQRESVGHPPVLDDSAVDHPRLIEYRDVNPPTRRGPKNPPVLVPRPRALTHT